MSTYSSETLQTDEFKRLYQRGDALRDIRATGESLGEDARRRVQRIAAKDHAQLCATLKGGGTKLLLDLRKEGLLNDGDWWALNAIRPNIEEDHESDIKTAIVLLGKLSRRNAAFDKDDLPNLENLLAYQVSAEEIAAFQESDPEVTVENVRRLIVAARHMGRIKESADKLEKYREKGRRMSDRIELQQHMIEHHVTREEIGVTDKDWVDA